MKLDEVYISLRAQRDKTPGEVDRRLLEKELAQLETEMVHGNSSAEELEDQREYLVARIENRLVDSKAVPGEVLELAEAVNRHERLVILGDPGSGKSTPTALSRSQTCSGFICWSKRGRLRPRYSPFSDFDPYR